MGRKKGKQRGQHSSKAKNAAHQFELNQHVSDTRDQWRGNTRHSTGTRARTRNQESELTKLRIERGAVSLSYLRGMLRERIFDDRERDASFRRHMMTSSVTIRQQQQQSRHKQNTNDGSTTKLANPIGWILTYNHREAMAGIDQQRDNITNVLLENNIPKQNIHISTLQMLCVKVLAPHLQQYIDSCGEEYILDRLSLLPSCVISALSVSCTDVTDQVAYAMGNHSHLEALVLCASLSFSDGCDDGSVSDKNNMKSSTKLTDVGLLSMLPSTTTGSSQFEINTSELSNNNNNNMSTTTLLDSWEEYQEIHHDKIILSKQYTNLKRLELRNFQTKCGNKFIQFLEQNPYITHLCLSQSFNGISGPQILLLNDNDDDGDNENNDDENENGNGYKNNNEYYNQMNNSDGFITILSILENLQVLDLSGCKWVHYDLLHTFLQRILHQNSSSHLSLEMIVIDQCCTYLTQGGCEMLNRMTDGKPVICTKML